MRLSKNVVLVGIASLLAVGAASAVVPQPPMKTVHFFNVLPVSGQVSQTTCESLFQDRTGPITTLAQAHGEQPKATPQNPIQYGPKLLVTNLKGAGYSDFAPGFEARTFVGTAQVDFGGGAKPASFVIQTVANLKGQSTSGYMMVGGACRADYTSTPVRAG